MSKSINNRYLVHHGIKGQRWGIRRYQNYDGTLTAEGKRRAVFVSGSSKTQSKDSGYYRKKLPRPIRRTLNGYMRDNVRINVGDAPGIDRQVQDYLNKKRYKNVEVYGPGTKVRYSANKKWKTNPIDAPEFEPGSKEWLAKKDIAMEKDSTEGLAVVLDEGAKATRKNVERMLANNKDVKVYQLNKNGKDNWANKPNDRKISKKVVVGATIAGTVLVAYGAYKLSKYNFKRHMRKGDAAILMQRINNKIAEEARINRENKYADFVLKGAENYGKKADSEYRKARRTVYFNGLMVAKKIMEKHRG